MRRLHFMSFLLCFCLVQPVPGQTSWIHLSPTDLATEWSIKGKAWVMTEGNHLVLQSKNSESAWMISRASYQDFRLQLDFKLEEGAEGKVVFRYADSHGADPIVNGYPVQLSNHPDQQNPTGSIVNLARATWLEDLDKDGWNTLDIMAIGDHLKVLINGHKVAETHSRRSRSGHIGLSADDSKAVRYRNIRLKTFSPVTGHGPMIEDRLRSHPNRYEEIFDGKSMEGWTKTGTSTWDIKDGVLHGYSGKEGGFLCHHKAYHNFHMKAKFKIIKEDNSGIFIRKPLDSTNVSTATGNSIECNIYDHNGFEHAYSTGSLAPHARAWSNITDYEDWNLADIYAVNDQIVMYINGMKAAEAHIPAFNHTGQICLQAGIKVFAPDKGPSDIYFKDLFVKAID